MKNNMCADVSCCHYYKCLMTNLDAYHSSWHIRDRTQSSLVRKDPNCLCLCLSTESILRSDFHLHPGCGCCCFHRVIPSLALRLFITSHLLPGCDARTRLLEAPQGLQDPVKDCGSVIFKPCVVIPTLFCFVLFCFVLEIGSYCIALAVLELTVLNRPALQSPTCVQSTCLCLLSAGIKGMCHCT